MSAIMKLTKHGAINTHTHSMFSNCQHGRHGGSKHCLRQVWRCSLTKKTSLLRPKTKSNSEQFQNTMEPDMSHRRGMVVTFIFWDIKARKKVAKLHVVFSLKCARHDLDRKPSDAILS